MRKILSSLVLAAIVVTPVASFAAVVDASLIPDGTYLVKVQKIQDAEHVVVLMQNGVQTTLAARGSINFSTVHASQTIKISIVKGKVPVYVMVGQ